MQAKTKGKRKAILEAASLVFRRDGFNLAKVEDIAITAGIGKGTVYEYFSSKAQLFLEIYKESLMSLLHSIEAIKQENSSPPNKLETLARLLLEHIVKSKDLSRTATDISSQLDEEFMVWMRDIHVRKISLIQDVFDEGIRSGEFRKVNSYTAALMFTGTVSALFAPITFADVEFNYDEYIRESMDLVLRGIAQ